MTAADYWHLAATDPLVIPGTLVWIALVCSLAYCLRTWWRGGQL